MANRKWKNLVRDSSGSTTREYNIWTAIKRRCNPESSEQKRHKGYVNCVMQEDWYDFDFFCSWLVQQPFWCSRDHLGNYYEIEKDILSKFGKGYLEDTVLFVPHCINTFIVGESDDRGATYNKRLGRYVSQINDYTFSESKRKHLGVFDFREQAIIAYKKEKAIIAEKLYKMYYGKVDIRVGDFLKNRFGGIDD